jgi:hypothetical protein
MVDVPAAEQVAATEVMVGVAGVVNCAALLKDEDAPDVQVPFPALTV